jgi:transposase
MSKILGSRLEQEARRLAAGRLLLACKKNAEVVRALNVSPSSVKHWKKIGRRHGIDGLRSKPPPGRPPRLSKRQRKTLAQILLRGAKAAGFSSDLWTGKRLAEVIRRRFNVEYHHCHVWKILRQLHSPHKSRCVEPNNKTATRFSIGDFLGQQGPQEHSLTFCENQDGRADIVKNT